VTRHLLIVGAGVVGSSAKRIADEHGWASTLADGNPHRAASRAALATIRPQWLGEHGKTIAGRSWRWYDDWGATVTRQALVTSYRNLEPRPQSDWWLVDPDRILVQPDLEVDVEHVWCDNGRVHARINGEPRTYDACLMATGAYGRDFIGGYKEQHGATLINRNLTLDAPLYVHHLRPYHSLTVGDVGGAVRLGSSVASTPDKAVTEIRLMLDAAERLGLVPRSDDWQLSVGIRAKAPKPVVPLIGQNVARIGNLGRSGYGLAPALIAQWLLTL